MAAELCGFGCSRNGAKRFIPIAYRVIAAVHFAHGNLGLLDVADFSLEFLASFGECIFNVVSCAERAGITDPLNSDDSLRICFSKP